MSLFSLDAEESFRLLENRALRERAARLTAEELLEKKSLELFEANQRLAALNENLEGRVKERTRELEYERQRALVLAEKDYLT
ncbi:MAG: putative bifunctional diguanylate cyclase/phosphodiesterase, partial [Geminicoccaceae bacterium]